MHFPKRKPKPYEAERDRLLLYLNSVNPATEAYEAAMQRLNELDKILNRTSELKKSLIPALGGIGAVGGIYALQQFAGVLVPKALESYRLQQEQKHHKELD